MHLEYTLRDSGIDHWHSGSFPPISFFWLRSVSVGPPLADAALSGVNIRGPVCSDERGGHTRCGVAGAPPLSPALAVTTVCSPWRWGYLSLAQRGCQWMPVEACGTRRSRLCISAWHGAGLIYQLSFFKTSLLSFPVTIMPLFRSKQCQLFCLCSVPSMHSEHTSRR